jgi:hypothetical protein
MGLSYSISLPLGALGAFVLYVAYTEAYLPTRGPRIAPGPESAHWFFGNQRQGEQGTLHARLVAEYGPVVSYISFGHVCPLPLCTSSPRSPRCSARACSRRTRARSRTS